MAIEAEALRASEETKASAWRPMEDAPTGVPIVAKHKPNKATPHGWVATILLGHDDEDEPGELDTILHYNGDALYRGFHGCWDGWMTCEEAGSLINRSALAEDTARAVEGAWAAGIANLRELSDAIETAWAVYSSSRYGESSRRHDAYVQALRDFENAAVEFAKSALDKEAADANR